MKRLSILILFGWISIALIAESDKTREDLNLVLGKIASYNQTNKGEQLLISYKMSIFQKSGSGKAIVENATLCVNENFRFYKSDRIKFYETHEEIIMQLIPQKVIVRTSGAKFDNVQSRNLANQLNHFRDSMLNSSVIVKETVSLRGNDKIKTVTLSPTDNLIKSTGVLKWFVSYNVKTKAIVKTKIIFQNHPDYAQLEYEFNQWIVQPYRPKKTTFHKNFFTNSGALRPEFSNYKLVDNR